MSTTGQVTVALDEEVPFSVSTRNDHHDQPILITDAPLSYDEELAIRKRRYAWTMGLRIPLMIAALACASVPWLAVTLLLASVPLPWAAVLMANDRLPRRVEDAHRYRGGRVELEARPHPVIDGPAPGPSGPMSPR